MTSGRFTPVLPAVYGELHLRLGGQQAHRPGVSKAPELQPGLYIRLREQAYKGGKAFRGQNTDTITFKYDPFGRRIEKNVSTVENSFPTTYKYTYVYDNEDIILEVLDKTQNAVTTTTTTSYVHGPGIDEPLSLARNGQTYYYHADGLGSVTSMTDNTQAVVNRYSYDSFGNVQRAETVWNDFTYTGREYDDETGLLFLRARYYEPEVGRFVSKDPIGFAGGDVNLYGYVGNKSINFIDPFGLIWVTKGYDYHGISNWLRWWLNRWARVIGEGGDPTFPGSAPEEYIGLTRDIIQEWQHDPNNPCRDKENQIGSQRRIRQTYMQFFNLGLHDALTNDPEAKYFYQWTPWIGSPTYEDPKAQYWRQGH